MEIRRATADDAEQLALQMKAVVDEGDWLATQADRPLEDLVEMFRSGLDEGHIVFLVEDDEQVVGAAGVHPTKVAGVHGLGMSILAEHRGQGWGRRLLEATIDAAREAGVRKIELEVFPDNARAIALYISAGFEVEGLKRDHYPRLDGSLRSALLMAKFLGRL